MVHGFGPVREGPSETPTFISQPRKQPRLALLGDAICATPRGSPKPARHTALLRTQVPFPGNYSDISLLTTEGIGGREAYAGKEWHFQSEDKDLHFAQTVLDRLIPLEERITHQKTPVSLLLNAVRRGIDLAKVPTVSDRPMRGHLELSIEPSTLFIRPAVHRGMHQEPPTPKVATLSMAALAFERGTEDLDDGEVLPELEASQNIVIDCSESPTTAAEYSLSPPSDQEKVDEEDFQTPPKKSNMNVQSSPVIIESAILMSPPLPEEGKSNLSIIKEEHVLGRREDLILHREPSVSSASGSESEDLQYSDLPVLVAVPDHTMAAEIPGPSSGAQSESASQVSGCVPQSSKLESEARSSKAIRLKAAARRAKAELRAVAAAATRNAHSEDDPERLIFLGIGVEHDKLVVRPPLIRASLDVATSVTNVIPDAAEWATQVFTQAKGSYEGGYWQHCVLACSAIITSAVSTYVTPALELRAACWLKLRVWHQLIADCTLTVQRRGVATLSLSWAYARRAHARLNLSNAMLVTGLTDRDANEQARFALIDAKLGRKCDGAVTEKFRVGGGISFDDDPNLLRAGVFRGLNQVSSARIELEAAMKTRPRDWRLLWSLGDLLVDEAGINCVLLQPSMCLENQMMPLDLQTHADTGTRTKQSTSLKNASNLVFKAFVIAVETKMLRHVPLNLMIRYGNILLARLYMNRAKLQRPRTPQESPIPQQDQDEILKQVSDLRRISRSILEGENLKCHESASHVAALSATAILQARSYGHHVI